MIIQKKCKQRYDSMHININVQVGTYHIHTIYVWHICVWLSVCSLFVMRDVGMCFAAMTNPRDWGSFCSLPQFACQPCQPPDPSMPPVLASHPAAQNRNAPQRLAVLGSGRPDHHRTGLALPPDVVPADLPAHTTLLTSRNLFHICMRYLYAFS